MCVAERLIAPCWWDQGQGSERGGGGAGDGDDGGLPSGRPANVGGEVGAQLANPDHVYSSVHNTLGAPGVMEATLRT